MKCRLLLLLSLFGTPVIAAPCIDWDDYFQVASEVGTSNSSYDLTAVGDLLLVGGLRSYDVSDPANPILLDNLTGNGNIRDVVYQDGHAYLSELDALVVIDVTNPEDLQRVAVVPAAGFNESVSAHGPHACLAGHVLHVFDISYPAAPIARDTIDTPGDARGVVIVGAHAFVASQGAGLLVYDLDDPELPLVGSVSLAGVPVSIAAMGDLAFVATGSSVHVFDIANPLAPEWLAVFAPGNGLTDITCAGTLLYISSSQGVHVYDFADPAHPVPVLFESLPAGGIGITVGPGYAAVVRSTSVTLMTGTVSSRYLDLTNASGAIEHLDVAGGRACAVSGSSILTVLDVSDPEVTSVTGTANCGGQAHDVAIAGNLAFVANGTIGLTSVTLADPSDPEVLDSVSFSGAARLIDLMEHMHTLQRNRGNST